MKPSPYPTVFYLNLNLLAAVVLAVLVSTLNVRAAVEITDAKVFLQGGVGSMDAYGEQGWDGTYWTSDMADQQLPGALGSHSRSYDVSAHSPSGTSGQMTGGHTTVMGGCPAGIFLSSKSTATATTNLVGPDAYAEAYAHEQVWLFFTNDAPITYNVQISGTNDGPSSLPALWIQFNHNGGSVIRDFTGGSAVSKTGVLNEGETSLTIEQWVLEQHSGSYNVSLTVGPSAVILSPISVTNNQLVIPAVGAKAGATYTLESSTSPRGGWAPTESKVADGAAVEFRPSIANVGQTFFRVTGPAQ